MQNEFRVLAKGDTLVLDVAFARSSGGKLRFVGRQLHTCEKHEDVPAGAVIRERDPVEPGDTFYVEGWTRKSEPTIVPATGEFGQYYRDRIREGGLWAADRETAEACGVKFDSTFGGDYLAEKPVKGSTKGGE